MPVVAIRPALIRAVAVLAFMLAAGAAQAVVPAIERARDWLVTRQRADGAIADAGNPLFETWETVIAARALASSRAARDMAATAAALDYLERQQNADGLLCHNRRCREATCVETSAEYLQLLIDAGDRSRARERWPALLAHRQPDGRFLVGNPDVRERRDFASVTAFVLAVGLRLGQHGPALQRSQDWLRRARTPRGDFGSAWEYYGTPAYALWPAARAWSGQSAAARQSRRDLLDWARTTQHDDGRWSFQQAVDGHQVSDALETALMLLAVRESAAPARPASPAHRALLKLQQPDGHWEGGWFPVPSAPYEKREDVFATAIAILALQAEASSR